MFPTDTGSAWGSAAIRIRAPKRRSAIVDTSDANAFN